MANSKLLKEAIADAKAVRETAIANAKIALEEAFTPRLQSILSKKLQAEMEGDDEDIEEELDSSDIGDGDEESPVEPSADASNAHTELGPESEEETAEVGDELEEGDHSEDDVSEEEDIEEVDGVGYDDPTNADDAEISEEEGEEEIHSEEEEIEEEDELDLESIIRELEMGMEDEEEVHSEEESEEEVPSEEEVKEEEEEVHSEDSHEGEEEEDMDDEIDLDEIIREMGYGDDEEVSEEEHEDSEMEEKYEELEKDLEEAYTTIKSLKGTINEVNLLNAKLLYANRLFRAYNLNNEQKSKVVENLDRTTSVREVKLVYATLAESMNFTGTEKKTKKVVAEAASKPVASTAPEKEIISENTNVLAERFKQLANIK